jgi:hypothetical protein
MRLRKHRTAPETLTPAQIAMARELARETLKADHQAIERYARFAVPQQVPDDGQQREEANDG